VRRYLEHAIVVARDDGCDYQLYHPALTLLLYASTAGGISWGCTIFDVLKANEWEEVVEALTSNIADRTDEVLLIFERPLESASEAK
jgi:hypothetical protein